MYSPDRIGYRGTTRCLVARASAHPTWQHHLAQRAGNSDAMLHLDGGVGVNMFAELGDPPRAMRLGPGVAFALCGFSATLPHRTASLAGFFDLSHVLDGGPLR